MSVEYAMIPNAAIEHADDGEIISYNSFGFRVRPGDIAKDFNLSELDPDRNVLRIWSLKDFPGEVAIYVNNSPLTGTCEKGLMVCQAMIDTKALPEGATLLSASYDDERSLAESDIRHQVNYPLLSTRAGLFLPDYGYYLSPQGTNHPELEGMGMRGLVVIGRQSSFNPAYPRQILYEEAVFEQNGPQPNFEAGFATITAVRPKKHFTFFPA